MEPLTATIDPETVEISKRAPTEWRGQRTFPAKRSPTMKLRAKRCDVHRARQLHPPPSGFD
ncbi:MAG: hypothetical protein CMM01_05845 [Rhodopirellula sp.]|nr:hypothetical protein [Rhodopirellula sp.]OUX52116.1 MAG: hypothetical protein CBE43_01405 [Rhodopirellula sp. TMED283]